MSIIFDALAEVTDKHALDPITDACKRDKTCHLGARSEFTFVGLTASYALDGVRAGIAADAKFHEWVYVPSLTAENTVGYDLSLGKFDDLARRRAQSMHKFVDEWCDEFTDWKPKDPGDLSHAGILLANAIGGHIHSEDGTWPIRVDLIVHICGCIHEYRRMGVTYNIPIPSLSSRLRCAVVPLGRAAEHVLAQGAYGYDEKKKTTVLSGDVEIDLSYARANPDPELPPAEYLAELEDPERHRYEIKINGASVDKGTPLTLEQWREEAVKHLA